MPARAKFCRECGASDDAGWDVEDDTSDLDTSAGWDDDPDFDYDEYIAREFPKHANSHAQRPDLRWLLLGAVAVLCIALLLMGLL